MPYDFSKEAELTNQQLSKKKYLECHYYELETKNFESCPITVKASDALTERCIGCQYNTFNSEATKQFLSERSKTDYCDNCGAVIDVTNDEGCLFCGGGALDETW